jgi:glycosyltransferase involved in cell wall biosynthesis
LRDASKVIALSEIEAKEYAEAGVAKERIVIVPNGIDLSEYANLPSKGAFRKKFNISEDKKIILFLGRIHKTKGVDFLVKAYAHLAKNMKPNNALLVIAGPDDGYLSEIQALISSLKIYDTVLLTGPLYGRDKLEAYIDADVYVLPSRYDTFALTPLEAMACGTPVILTANCGIAEFFKDKVGLVIDPNPSSLHDALHKLLSNDDQTLYRENCKMLIKAFDISKVVSELERVYEEALSYSCY